MSSSKDYSITNFTKLNVDPSSVYCIQSGATKVAIAQDTRILVQDVGKRKMVREHTGAKITCMAFSSSGLSLASGRSDGTIELYSLNDDFKKSEAQCFTQPKKGAEAIGSISHITFPSQMAVKSGGKYIDAHFFVSSSKESLFVWDINSSKMTCSHTFESSITSLKISNNLKCVAVGCHDGSIQLFNLETKCLSATMQGHRAPVTHLAYHDEEYVLASGASDASILMWNVDEESSGNDFLFTKLSPVIPKITSRARVTSAVRGLQFTHGALIVVHDDALRVLGWDLTGHIGPMTFRQEDECWGRSASTKGIIRFTRLKSGTLMMVVPQSKSISCDLVSVSKLLPFDESADRERNSPVAHRGGGSGRNARGSSRRRERARSRSSQRRQTMNHGALVALAEDVVGKTSRTSRRKACDFALDLKIATPKKTPRKKGHSTPKSRKTRKPKTPRALRTPGKGARQRSSHDTQLPTFVEENTAASKRSHATSRASKDEVASSTSAPLHSMCPPTPEFSEGNPFAALARKEHYEKKKKFLSSSSEDGEEESAPAFSLEADADDADAGKATDPRHTKEASTTTTTQCEASADEVVDVKLDGKECGDVDQPQHNVSQDNSSLVDDKDDDDGNDGDDGKESSASAGSAPGGEKPSGEWKPYWETESLSPPPKADSSLGLNKQAHRSTSPSSCSLQQRGKQDSAASVFKRPEPRPPAHHAANTRRTSAMSRTSRRRRASSANTLRKWRDAAVATEDEGLHSGGGIVKRTREAAPVVRRSARIRQRQGHSTAPDKPQPSSNAPKDASSAARIGSAMEPRRDGARPMADSDDGEPSSSSSSSSLGGKPKPSLTEDGLYPSPPQQDGQEKWTDPMHLPADGFLQPVQPVSTWRGRPISSPTPAQILTAVRERHSVTVTTLTKRREILKNVCLHWGKKDYEGVVHTLARALKTNQHGVVVSILMVIANQVDSAADLMCVPLPVCIELLQVISRIFSSKFEDFVARGIKGAKMLASHIQQRLQGLPESRSKRSCSRTYHFSLDQIKENVTPLCKSRSLVGMESQELMETLPTLRV